MEKIHLYDKIISPIVTEKSTNLSEQNKIVFKVPNSANKKNLKNNIEKIFKVNVTKINIINKQNRTKFTRGRKWKLIYKEKIRSKKEAISREYYIKKNRTLRKKIKNENLNSITL